MSIADDNLDIGHSAPYECVACGGPEWSATSSSGCSSCGAQDDIVPRGTVALRRQQAAERDQAARAAAHERQQSLEQGIGAATEAEPFVVLYFDVYDDSLVTATFKGAKVELKRDDGSPMWSGGGNEDTKEHWDSLVRSGFFIPIDPRDGPEVAAQRLINQLG